MAFSFRFAEAFTEIFLMWEIEVCFLMLFM